MSQNINIDYQTLMSPYNLIYNKLNDNSDRPDLYCQAMVQAVTGIYEEDYPGYPSLNDDVKKELLIQYRDMVRNSSFAWHLIAETTNNILNSYIQNIPEDPTVLEKIEYYLS